MVSTIELEKSNLALFLNDCEYRKLFSRKVYEITYRNHPFVKSKRRVNRKSLDKNFVSSCIDCIAVLKFELLFFGLASCDFIGSVSRFLKYVWPFYNIMYERVNSILLGILVNQLINQFYFQCWLEISINLEITACTCL